MVVVNLLVVYSWYTEFQVWCMEIQNITKNWQLLPIINMYMCIQCMYSDADSKMHDCAWPTVHDLTSVGHNHIIMLVSTKSLLHITPAHIITCTLSWRAYMYKQTANSAHVSSYQPGGQLIWCLCISASKLLVIALMSLVTHFPTHTHTEPNLIVHA
jgi:hypothetical protein